MLSRRATGSIAEAAAAAAGRVLSREEIAARRAASLVGADVLRPQPTVEFVGALGRLSDAFRDVREGLQAIDGKVLRTAEAVDGLQRTLGTTKSEVDLVHDRLNVGGARIEGFEQRMVELETRQAEALAGMDERIGELSRLVTGALGLGAMLAVVGVVLLAVR